MAIAEHIPSRTVTRLILVLRCLDKLRGQGVSRVFSSELASFVGSRASQIRRDLMNVGASGCPNKGYDVCALRQTIEHWLHPAQPPRAALVGLGNLGRALTTYFYDRQPQLDLVAAFDTDPVKICLDCASLPIHHVDDLEKVCRERDVRVAILTLPAEAAQDVARRLVDAGVSSLVNFTHATLHMPEGVFVENVDLSVALDRAVFFLRNR